MGDKNIPVYFNNILREILFDIEQAKPYFDDILIGADDPWEFIEVVDKVLTRLKDRNGVVSKDKIRIGFEKMVALGFEVGMGEYSPKHSLKTKVLECALPTSKTRVQQWLGLIAQFGKHVDPNVLNEIRAVWAPVTGDK